MLNASETECFQCPDCNCLIAMEDLEKVTAFMCPVCSELYEFENDAKYCCQDELEEADEDDSAEL